MTIDRRTLKRSLAAVAVGAAVVLTLSGCLSMTANLTVNPDATASGTFALGFDKQAASLLGMKDLGSFTSGMTSGDAAKAGGDMLASQDCAPSETDTEFVITCTFTDKAFAGGGDSPWTITRNGDTITFRMADSSQATSDITKGIADGSLGTIDVNVTFPGPITSVSGDMVTKTSDTSVEIKGDLTSSIDVTVVSSASSTTSTSRVLLILGLAVVGLIAILIAIAVVVVVVVLILRRRHDDAPVLTAPAAPAAVEPPAAQPPASGPDPAP